MTLTEAAPLTTANRPAQFAGFDCGAYPGDHVMSAWAGGKSPYSFCCFYLDAPCHTRRGFSPPWSGKRELLDQLGWGFVVTYVGRQAQGCGDEQLSRESGLVDGKDTLAKARAEGFPSGTILFLDVEAISGTVPKEYLEYFGGWISAVIGSEFKAGFYCTMANRMTLIVASNAEYAAKNPVGDDSAALWIVNLAQKFSISSAPADCGVSYASLWQGKFGVRNETHNGASIPIIDLDVAKSADPSRGRIAPST